MPPLSRQIIQQLLLRMRSFHFLFPMDQIDVLQSDGQDRYRQTSGWRTVLDVAFQNNTISDYGIEVGRAGQLTGVSKERMPKSIKEFEAFVTGYRHDLVERLSFEMDLDELTRDW